MLLPKNPTLSQSCRDLLLPALANRVHEGGSVRADRGHLAGGPMAGTWIPGHSTTHRCEVLWGLELMRAEKTRVKGLLFSTLWYSVP